MTQAEEAGATPRTASAPARRHARKAGLPRPDDQHTAGQDCPLAAHAVAWHPPLRDDEVDAVEREITDDDLRAPADPHEHALVENACHRLADRMLLEELTATGFTGVLFEVAVTEFAAYGIAVMMAWMRTGKIVSQCKARGRPLALGSAAGRWTRDDRLEIALETTGRAMRFFIENVLKPGKWDHRRGATLKTFFVGACLLQFPNVFDLWANELRRWDQVNTTELGADETTADGASRDACWSDPTGDTVIRRQRTQEALSEIKDPRTRRAVEMVMGGHTFKEAGKAVGLSAEAVEGRLYRLRRRPQ